MTATVMVQLIQGEKETTGVGIRVLCVPAPDLLFWIADCGQGSGNGISLECYVIGPGWQHHGNQENGSQWCFAHEERHSWHQLGQHEQATLILC